MYRSAVRLISSNRPLTIVLEWERWSEVTQQWWKKMSSTNKRSAVVYMIFSVGLWACFNFSFVRIRLVETINGEDLRRINESILLDQPVTKEYRWAINEKQLWLHFVVNTCQKNELISTFIYRFLFIYFFLWKFPERGKSHLWDRWCTSALATEYENRISSMSHRLVTSTMTTRSFRTYSKKDHRWLRLSRRRIENDLDRTRLRMSLWRWTVWEDGHNKELHASRVTKEKRKERPRRREKKHTFSHESSSRSAITQSVLQIFANSYSLWSDRHVENSRLLLQLKIFHASRSTSQRPDTVRPAVHSVEYSFNVAETDDVRSNLSAVGVLDWRAIGSTTFDTTWPMLEKSEENREVTDTDSIRRRSAGLQWNHQAGTARCTDTPRRSRIRKWSWSDRLLLLLSFRFLTIDWSTFVFSLG